MTETRVGLVGYGGWTRSAYVPALRLDGRARIVAAAAPSAATRGRITAELGSDLAVYDGAEALLAEAEIDAAFIAVPDSVHEAAVRAALDAGVPFFYEPPVADRPTRVPPLLEKLLAARQITHADLELSYLPVVTRAAELLADGEVGVPQTVAIRLQSTWGATPHAELSVTHHLAPWYLDVLDRVLGRHPERILVLDGRGTPGRMQGFAVAQLDYGDVWGTYQVNIGGIGALDTKLEINGTEGDLIVDLIGGELRLRTRRYPHWRIENIPALEPHANWPGMHECVRAFLDAVESGEPSLSGPESVARQHLAGLAAEAAIDAGGWATIASLEELIAERA